MDIFCVLHVLKCVIFYYQSEADKEEQDCPPGVSATFTLKRSGRVIRTLSAGQLNHSETKVFSLCFVVKMFLCHYVMLLL